MSEPSALRWDILRTVLENYESGDPVELAERCYAFVTGSAPVTEAPAKRPPIVPPLADTKIEEPGDTPAKPGNNPGKTGGESGAPKLTGRAKDAYDLLCSHANEGRELPITISQFMTDAGIPRGSAGYVRDKLETKGFVTWLSPDDGRWGAELQDGVEIYSPFPKAPTKNEQPGRKGGGTSMRRFTEHRALDPESVIGLSGDHKAVTEGRTLFPSTVVDSGDGPRLLVSGQNSRKTGAKVIKGAWASMPIFTLTLEERATCPETCFHWRTCYGNGMPLARRHRHGPVLEDRLQSELAVLQERHSGGFVVRLHILGDFYSIQYVNKWLDWLQKFKALRVFGYTAHDPDSEIGQILYAAAACQWERFAIRFSSTDSKFGGVTTIWRKPEGPTVPEGIVCPAQTGATDCCGTCGLCWAEAAREKTIVFVVHGRLGKKSGRPPETIVVPAPPIKHEEPALPPWLDKPVDWLASGTTHRIQPVDGRPGLWVIRGLPGQFTPREILSTVNNLRHRSGLTPSTRHRSIRRQRTNWAVRWCGCRRPPNNG